MERGLSGTDFSLLRLSGIQRQKENPFVIGHWTVTNDKWAFLFTTVEWHSTFTD